MKNLKLLTLIASLLFTLQGEAFAANSKSNRSYKKSHKSYKKSHRSRKRSNRARKNSKKVVKAPVKTVEKEEKCIDFAAIGAKLKKVPSLVINTPATVRKLSRDATYAMSDKSVLSSSGKKSFKTQGHSVGFDLSRTRMEFTEYARYPVAWKAIAVLKYDNAIVNYAAGLNYKYAMNFDRFFVAPGVFFEKHSSSSTQRQDNRYYRYSSTRLRVNERFGARVDFGYDLTKNISPYVTLGYAGVSYRSNYAAADTDLVNRYSTKKGTAFSPLYGFGLNVDVSENVSLNAEYNIQHFNAKTVIHPSAYDYFDRTILRAKLEAIKIGASYNF